MDAEGDDGGQRLAARLGAAMEFVHPPARMQGHAEPIAPVQHQPMKAGGVDAGFGIAGADLAGGDIGCSIDREVDRDWQLGEIDGIAFHDQLLPGCTIDAHDRPVVLAALAKTRREHAGLDPQRGGEQSAVAGNIGDDRHIEALDSFEDDHRAAAGTLEFEDGRGDIELAPDGFVDAYQLIGVVALDHPQKAAQALLVHASLRAGSGAWDDTAAR
jgi:hypothetical protein